MPFSFQNPILLTLLGILPLIGIAWLIALRRKRKAFREMGDPALVSEIIGNYKRRSFGLKFALSIVALGLVLLTIANLRSRTGSQNVDRNGIDVMVALDVSKSMLAQDVQPDRLARAKQLLNKLIGSLSNDRVGLIVFAGRAYMQMPLTADHGAFSLYLSAATPQTVPTQGTVIGDALKACFGGFNNKEKKYKAVVLISDGEDHDEDALRIAGQMADEGVVINTVGIGSPQGATIPDEETGQPKTDQEGNAVVSRLNEEILANVAKKGNGTYVYYTSAEETSEKLSDALAAIPGRDLPGDSLNDYKSWFQILLAAGLLLLIMEIFVAEGRRRRIVKKLKPVAASILLSAFCSAAFSISANAQTDAETISSGNDAYKKGDFGTAAQRYKKAVANKPDDPVAKYNLGNAEYKKNNAQQAAKVYAAAEAQMKSPADKSNALYNKGVAEQSQKSEAECIQSYKNALKLNPQNVDARHNLQIALRKQKEKQEQEKKDQGGGSDKDQNKDKKKQNKNNMSQQEADQKLEALRQQERALQDKRHKTTAESPEKPEKDW